MSLPDWSFCSLPARLGSALGRAGLLDEPVPGSPRSSGERLTHAGVRGDSEGSRKDNPSALS